MRNQLMITKKHWWNIMKIAEYSRFNRIRALLLILLRSLNMWMINESLQSPYVYFAAWICINIAPFGWILSHWANISRQYVKLSAKIEFNNNKVAWTAVEATQNKTKTAIKYGRGLVAKKTRSVACYKKKLQ